MLRNTYVPAHIAHLLFIYFRSYSPECSDFSKGFQKLGLLRMNQALIIIFFHVTKNLHLMYFQNIAPNSNSGGQKLKAVTLIEMSSADSGVFCVTVSAQIISEALLRNTVPLNHYLPLRNRSLLALTLHQCVSLPFCRGKMPSNFVQQVIKPCGRFISYVQQRKPNNCLIQVGMSSGTKAEPGAALCSAVLMSQSVSIKGGLNRGSLTVLMLCVVYHLSRLSFFGHCVCLLWQPDGAG